MAEKRKTFTSYEVHRRYDTKTFKKYGVALRQEDDAALIAFIEQKQNHGMKTSDIFKAGIASLMEQEAQA